MVLCFELALFLMLCPLGGHVGVESALSFADAAHVLSDEVLLVLRSFLVLLDQIAPLVVNLSVLQLLSGDLRWSFGEPFHFKGLPVL